VAVHQIADVVALPAMHEREIRPKGILENVRPAVDDTRLLPFGDGRTVGGWCEEPSNARATRPNPLRERPLRHELDFQLPRQKLTLEFLVLADIARNHLAHLPRLEQHTDAPIVCTRIIADEN